MKCLLVNGSKNPEKDWKLLVESDYDFSKLETSLLFGKDSSFRKSTLSGKDPILFRKGPFVKKEPFFEEFAEIPGKQHVKDSMKEAIHMAFEGVYIPRNTLLHLIQQCIDEDDLTSGYDIHYIIQIYGLDSDAFMGSHLIRMYAAFGCLSKASKVFKKLLNPDVFSWNAIISAYTNLGYYHQAIHLYNSMRESGVESDGHVFVTVLKACCGIGSIRQGYCVHLNIIERGLESEVYVASTLIDMYAQCGNLEKACHVFGK